MYGYNYLFSVLGFCSATTVCLELFARCSRIVIQDEARHFTQTTHQPTLRLTFAPIPQNHKVTLRLNVEVNKMRFRFHQAIHFKTEIIRNCHLSRLQTGKCPRGSTPPTCGHPDTSPPCLQWTLAGISPEIGKLRTCCTTECSPSLLELRCSTNIFLIQSGSLRNFFMHSE